MRKFKLYFRKTSFKKDLESANLLLDQIYKNRPKNFLEVGVFQGVTARNVCEVLKEIYQNEFKYIGIDLFSSSNLLFDNKAKTLKYSKISNPFKNFYFNFLRKENLNSKKAVSRLLKKFNNNISLYEGYSDKILNSIDISYIDMVFLDGGHSYEVVKKDLKILITKLKKNKIIICDDYDQKKFGVKRAVDEFRLEYKIEMVNERIVKILTWKLCLEV